MIIARPAWTDDDEQHVAAVECLADMLAEIDPDRDRVVIHEHDAMPLGIVTAIVLVQAIEDASGDAGAVLAAI